LDYDYDNDNDYDYDYEAQTEPGMLCRLLSRPFALEWAGP